MRDLTTKELNSIAGGTIDEYYPILLPGEELIGYGVEITYDTFVWTEKKGLFDTVEHVETYPVINTYPIIETTIVYVY